MKKLLLFISLVFVFSNVYSQINISKSPKTDFRFEQSEWSNNSVLEIESKFNEARFHEELDLNISLPNFKFPNNYNNYSNSDKFLWLVNKERKDRGLSVLEDVSLELNSKSELSLLSVLNSDNVDINERHDNRSFILNSEYLLYNQNEKEKSSRDIIEEDELIIINTSENGVRAIEYIFYNLMYNDSYNEWKNRDFILNTDFIENGGNQYKEGLLGLSLIEQNDSEGNLVHALSVIFFDPGVDWNYKPYENTSKDNIEFDLKTSSGVLTLNIREKSDSLKVEIYNLIGQQIINQNVEYGINNSFNIDGPKGYYLVKVSSNVKSKAIKVYIP